MNKKHIYILIGLSALLFFFRLGHFSLYDAAETTYGEFIKQMRLTGDWMTLRYNGQIIFDKPPFYYWLATMATYVFGFNEFAIRFWAALSGALTVLVTYKLGKEFYNEKVGFFAGLIIMTSFQFLIQSRIAEIDIMLTLLICSSLLFFWQKKYYLMYFSMALATVLKGIIGAALPGFAIFLFLFLSRDLKRLREMKILWGTILFSLFSFPWYLIEYLKHGQVFAEFALGFLFLSRFQGVVAGHPGPWYYYFLVLILGFAPWSHFLPYALARTLQSSRLSTQDSILKTASPALLTLCFLVPIFLVFSIAKTKLPSYLLPAFPFLGIIVAKLWADFLEDTEKLRQGMMLANALLAFVVILIIIGFVILGQQNYSGQFAVLQPDLRLLAVILAAGSLLSTFYFLISNFTFSFYSLPLTTFLITLVLTTSTLPKVETYKGTKELAQKVSAAIKPGEKIAAYNAGNRPGVVFYNQQPILFLNNKEDADKFLKAKNGFLFTAKEETKNLKSGHVFAEQGELIVIR